MEAIARLLQRRYCVCNDVRLSNQEPRSRLSSSEYAAIHKLTL